MTKKQKMEDAETKPTDVAPIEGSIEPAPSPEPKVDAKKEEDVHDRLIRLAADFDNFRKRVQKEKADYVRYATENVMKELLPVLDNFERAMEHQQKNGDADSIRRGVELTFNQLRNALTKFGLRSESALGKEFDPLIHEAVSHIPTKDHPPHTVIEEIQKAYFLNDRLIRPATVAVSKLPEPEEEGAEEADSNQQSE